MILLSIDTCDGRGSVCLCRDGAATATAVHDTQEDYSSWLIPAIQRVIAEAGVTLGSVEAYSVASGPGSFTGLRVGLSTVKGLAEVYGRPIAPVSRLEAIASLAQRAAEWIASIVDAGRGEVYGALYRRERTGLTLMGEECVLPPLEFLEMVTRKLSPGSVAWVSPEAGRLAIEPWWPGWERKVDALEVVTSVLAPVIGRIGYRWVAEGRVVDSVALEANYVRRSDAERFWKSEPRPSVHAR